MRLGQDVFFKLGFPFLKFAALFLIGSESEDFQFAHIIYALDITLFRAGDNERVDGMMTMVETFVPIFDNLLAPFFAVMLTLLDLGQFGLFVAVEVEVMQNFIPPPGAANKINRA